MNLQESIRRILREEYSPAGNEIIPNRIIVHKSNPIWRKNILETGLQVSVGECYKTYVGYGEKCKPAIFATNSTNKRAWFDSTYDDDIWFIDTTKIPDVKWFKDRHFESTKKHIVTFQDIPPEALTLQYEGTGRSEDLLEESIRRILDEEVNKSNFFIRRVNLDEVNKRLSVNAEQVYYEIENYNQFKYELTLRAVEEVIWEEHKLGWEDLPSEEEIEFVIEVSNMFEKTIKELYNFYQNK